MSTESTGEVSASMPQRPAKAHTQLRETGDGVEFDVKPGAGFVKIFLSLWLAGWTIGCVALAHKVATDFKWIMLLFAVPFWAGEVFVAGLLVHMYTGVERLRINHQGITLDQSSALKRRVQQTSFSQLRKLEVGDRIYDSDTDAKCYGLRIETSELPMVFGLNGMGPNLTIDEARWIEHEALLAVGTFGGEEVFDRLASGRGSVARLRELDDIGPSNQKNVTDLAPVGPIQIFDEPSGVRLIRPAVFTFGAFAGVTFIALFWNSIVGVFIWALIFDPPPGIMRVFLFLFLIPFELIGLLFIFAWFATLLAPIRDQVWIFASDQIVTRWRMLGVSLWSRSVPGATVQRIVAEPARLEGLALKVAAKNPDALRRAQEQLRDRGGWQIAVYSDTDQPVLTVPLLTEEQTAPIEAALRRRLPKWFDEPGQTGQA